MSSNRVGKAPTAKMGETVQRGAPPKHLKVSSPHLPATLPATSLTALADRRCWYLGDERFNSTPTAGVFHFGIYSNL
jgi:hypothetical protein